MAKKTCSKGHIYDSATYGDVCPLCPSGGTVVNNNYTGRDTVGNYNRTEIHSDNERHYSGQTTGHMPTIPMDDGANSRKSKAGGGTVIRPIMEGTGTSSGKKVVGLLITYDIISSGQVFNIYEGRNYIGRDNVADVSIQGDSQISSKHFSILYRIADGKFKFRDEQSSNGTFLNDALTDEGELNTFDIIRIGSTKLIFIAIPQIP